MPESSGQGNGAVRESVLVVSIDALAPRAISPETTPALCALARSGAACFTGTTVNPSTTLTAHTSMLRGVSPSVHGVLHNTVARGPMPPSFLHSARQGGLSTGSVLSWALMDQMIEPDAVTYRVLLDEGYNPEDDRFVADETINLLNGENPKVVFCYLIQPDLAGHDFGWDSPEYGDAVNTADALLGEIIDAAGPDRAILVTTDHGGSGTGHSEANAETTDIFLVARSAQLRPGTWWPTISPLNVAPTVAHLAGFAPHPDWEGTSLVGADASFSDHLVTLMEGMQSRSYGEDLNMLEHSLQTAAAAAEHGGSDHAVLAGLLHDLGHELGEAGGWGLPGHADEAARFLRPWLPASIVQPIRLHVQAKRYLVATDPGYSAQLSEASKKSLREQGGPLSAADAAAFERLPFSQPAVQLRRFDDAGKIPTATVARLEHYLPLLTRALGADGLISPLWARDACTCEECRDTRNGQHLLNSADLAGWAVESVHGAPHAMVATLVHNDGRRHKCILPASSKNDELSPQPRWRSEHLTVLRERTDPASGPVDRFVADLAKNGIALVSGLGSEPGQVLEFARRIGFVRETNYGDLFDVRTDPEPINLAYTPKGLPLHTDNPYRDPVPTVQLLHCLVAAEGGTSLFCDGFAVAEQLRRDHPEDFARLSSTIVSFQFISPDVHLQARLPLIRLDESGEVVRVTVNNRSMQPQPLGQGTEAFYTAYLRFAQLLGDPVNVIELRLAPGELVGFDNRRVLHGRTAFPNSPRRHLQGCYIDIDAIQSSARLQIR
ncbi:MAG: HD domain-containing protein [Acidimicrobiales bacterium]|nr:HD domain-containing protein [Acidimicrobiales bacterium]